MNSFIDRLRQVGKSESTVMQYRNTLTRFTGWLTGYPYPTPRTPKGSRGKGLETNTPFFNISTSSEFQREFPAVQRHFPDAVHTANALEALRGVTELDVADFKRWALQHYQPNTIKQMLIQLKAFYRWMHETSQVLDNPVTSVKAVTVVKQAPKWLTRNEQNQLVRAVRKHGNLRELTLITLMLHTGLRVQEVADLRLTDIEIGERKGKLTVRNGKCGRRREVPLNIDTRETLTQYLQGFMQEWLFPNKNGGHITTRSLQYVIEKYRKITGIEPLNAHSLRHSFCHELVSRKVPLDVVARLAGHVKNDGTPNIQQTLTYTQPGEDDLQRAVDELSWH